MQQTQLIATRTMLPKRDRPIRYAPGVTVSKKRHLRQQSAETAGRPRTFVKDTGENLVVEYFVRYRSPKNASDLRLSLYDDI